MLKEQQEILKQLNKIIEIFKASDGEVRPHFILTGPSGSGKSHTAAQLAENHDLGFIEINAAQLTREGTSGNSLSKALVPLLSFQGRPVICFVDEFDKLFISGNSNSDLAHETTNGVQNEFLKTLESGTTQVFGDYGKYVTCNIENVLFIFAGAFNGAEDIDLDKLREFGLKTEFLGRVGLTFHLEKLSLASMIQVLEDSSLLSNYLQLFPKAKREKVLSDLIAVVKSEYDNNTLGIRMINTLLHQYFISGGKINSKESKKITFQTKLNFD